MSCVGMPASLARCRSDARSDSLCSPTDHSTWQSRSSVYLQCYPAVFLQAVGLLPFAIFWIEDLAISHTQRCGTACMQAWVSHSSVGCQLAAALQPAGREEAEQQMSLCGMKAYLCLSSVMLSWVPEGRAELTKSRSVPGRPEMVLTSIASLCATAPQVSVAQVILIAPPPQQ